MKKPCFLFFLATFATICTFASCGDKTVAVNDVAIVPNMTTVEVRGKETLSVIILPSDAANKSVKWSSNNTSIATVLSGVVTGVAEGETSIVAITDDGAKMAGCKVTVVRVPVTGVSLKTSIVELDLELDNWRKLEAEISPKNATNLEVTWESDDTDVATVDKNGEVTAVGVGEAIITVTTVEGNYKAICLIKVTDVSAPAGTY
jgi:uncharacterized protein YjdB